MRPKRHDALRDIIYHCVLTDNKEARIEQRSNPVNLKRPGGIFHPDFLEGKPAYFDVSIRNPLLLQFIINSATAAAAGELEKDDKYDEDVSLSGSSFYPLIAETLGIWSPKSLRILKIIALRSAVTSNLSASQAVMNLHEQPSVCLWRYNAKMLLNRLCWGDLNFS